MTATLKNNPESYEKLSRAANSLSENKELTFSPIYIKNYENTEFIQLNIDIPRPLRESGLNLFESEMYEVEFTTSINKNYVRNILKSIKVVSDPEAGDQLFEF
jgi:hypothetical protein